jgi:hypothetical protein
MAEKPKDKDERQFTKVVQQHFLRTPPKPHKAKGEGGPRRSRPDSAEEDRQRKKER